MTVSPAFAEQPPRRFPPVGLPVPPSPDHYQLLHVDPLAAPEVIAAAFRALLRLRHPDVSANPLADTQTRQLLETARILGNATRRAVYDEQLRRRAVRLEEIEARLKPQTLDQQLLQLTEDLGLMADEYERLWGLLDGVQAGWASERLELHGDRCRSLLRRILTLPVLFDEGAASIVVPSGLGGAAGGYLAVLEETLGEQAAAASRLLTALRREHSEEIAAAFAACGATAAQMRARLACYRPHYLAALARARYVAAALG